MAAPHDPYTGMQKPPAKNVPPTTDKPTVPTKTQYYTTKSQALGSIGPDERGLIVRYAPGKGYFTGGPVKYRGSSGGGAGVAPPQGGSLESQAAAIVNSELNPLINQAKSSNLQQTQAIAAFTKMLLAAVKGTPASIGAGYDSAIGTQTNIANAAADALRNANPNQQDQHILNAVGAPDSQKNQLFGHLADTFGGGAAVGQYNNLLRTNDLQANKLASVNFAKTLPAIEGLRGNQSLQNALYTQQKSMSDLLSQRPKLVQDALNSLYDQSAKQQQLNIENQSLGLKAQNQGFSQNLAVSKLNQQQDQFIAKQTAKLTSDKKPNNSLSRSAGYIVDSNGSAILAPNGKRQILPGFSVNKQGRVIKTAKGSALKAQKTFGNLTKTQVQTLRSTANELRFGTTYQGSKPLIYMGKTYNTGDKIPATPYGKAISYLVGHGYSRTDAVAMLNNFYPAGKRGGKTKAMKAAAAKVAAANAAARQGKDASGLGIIVP